eukprot:1159466-Pelagomonas_calceolata.AAC.2
MPGTFSGAPESVSLSKKGPPYKVVRYRRFSRAPSSAIASLRVALSAYISHLYQFEQQSAAGAAPKRTVGYKRHSALIRGVQNTHALRSLKQLSQMKGSEIKA